MAQEKYYKVLSNLNKTRTFSLIMGKNKDEKNIVRNVTLTGSFPRPNPKLMTPGVSYINDKEKTGLEKEEGFNKGVEERIFKLEDILFDSLPEIKQKEYNQKHYINIKSKKQKSDSEAAQKAAQREK